VVKLRKIVVGMGVGMYLVGWGMLAGMALDRMRFDHQRSEVLARYERALTHLNAYRMALEKHAGGDR
jgi:hypothetical protein